MKGLQIVFDEIAGRQVAALMRDGRLDDLLIEPVEGSPPAPGAIFRAVADRPFKGQGGMTLRLPGGESALFRGAKGMSPGDVILVQVTSYAEAGKAVPVTDRLVFKGRYAIATPGAKGYNVSRQIRDDEIRENLLASLHNILGPSEDHGVIIRSSAADADPDEVASEADGLLQLTTQVLGDPGSEPELLVDAPGPQDLAWRDWPEAPITQGFEENGVLDAMAELDTPEVSFGSASMFVEATRALVAVDVNTGGDFSPASGLKANLAAARALPRALRLRGLGGQITMDLAPMPKKDRKQFEQVLRSAFKSDAIETSLVGWTPLGHFELQRKRERLPLPRGLMS